jgi:cytochrome c553
MIGAHVANNRRRPAVVAVIAMAAAVLALCLATCRSVAAGPDAPPSPDATNYLPSISDLMIATIQPRHERLWQAEQNGNWQFAAYEAGNLKGAFTRLGHAHPTQGDISFADMIASVTDQPFTELNSAIQSKDSTAFGKAYADLTEACNSCHQALNHGTVEIRVPSRTSPSDLGLTLPNR